MKPHQYFAFIISLVLFCSCTQKKVEFAYKQDKNGRLCIPVEINGKEKLFLFDTGCQGTLINYSVMKECGIQLEDSAFQTIHTPSDSTEGITHYSNIHLSIGGISFNSTVAADRYNREMFKNSYYDDFDGVLGVEDIQKFNWLFNFENKIVTLSRNPIKLPLLLDDQVLNFDFSKEKKSITYVDVNLNDSVKPVFLFDTGYSISFSITDEENNKSNMNGDFALVPSLKEYLNKSTPNCILMGDNMLLIDSLEMNNYKLSHLSSKRSDNSILTENVITNNFLRRFRLMYYDSTNKRISLYVSPKDTHIYKGENEKKIIDAIISAILKQSKGRKGEGFTVSIDSLEI